MKKIEKSFCTYNTCIKYLYKARQKLLTLPVRQETGFLVDMMGEKIFTEKRLVLLIYGPNESAISLKKFLNIKFP